MNGEVVMKAEITMEEGSVLIKVIKPYEIIIKHSESFNIGGGWDIDFSFIRCTNPGTKYFIVVEGVIENNKKKIYLTAEKIVNGQIQNKYNDIYDNIEGRRISYRTYHYSIAVGYYENGGDKYKYMINGDNRFVDTD